MKLVSTHVSSLQSFVKYYISHQAKIRQAHHAAGISGNPVQTSSPLLVAQHDVQWCLAGIKEAEQIQATERTMTTSDQLKNHTQNSECQRKTRTPTSHFVRLMLTFLSIRSCTLCCAKQVNGPIQICKHITFMLVSFRD